MSEFRRRPQVFLLGNGVNRAFHEKAFSWKKLLKETGNADVPDDIKIPLSLEVILRTENRASEKMKEKSLALYGDVDSEEYMKMLQDILEIGFDEILTTNYGYELESAAFGKVQITPAELKKIVRSTMKRVDAKFLLHTYNEVLYNGNENRIWHIHGEARKPAGMVIDHYQYGSLLNRFINFYRWRGNAYTSLKSYESLTKESFLDAFMAGDIYILGQGLDFAEMDLWWLLNRKHRESHIGGKVYIYEPKSDREYDGRVELLKLYGAEILHLGYELPESPGHRAQEKEKKEYKEKVSKIYHDFYKDALVNIKSKVQEKTEEATQKLRMKKEPIRKTKV